MRTLLQESNDKQELKIYADNKESYFNKDVLNVTSNDEVIGQVIVLRNITPFSRIKRSQNQISLRPSLMSSKRRSSSIKLSAQIAGRRSKVGILTRQNKKELLDSISDDSDRLLNITGGLLNMTAMGKPARSSLNCCRPNQNRLWTRHFRQCKCRQIRKTFPSNWKWMRIFRLSSPMLKKAPGY